jgi:hypothetical protein
MGFFTKSGTPKTSKHFKSELARASNDRDRLRAQLPEARANLSLAVDERRAALTVKAMTDLGVVPRDKIDTARGRVEDLEYLIGELDAKIAGLEVEFATALDRETREAAVAELAHTSKRSAARSTRSRPRAS